MSGADASNARLVVEAFGGAPRYTPIRSNGTAAVPTQVLSGDALFTLSAQGHDNAAGFVGGPSINFAATQNYTAAQAGCKIELSTIPNGALAQVVALTLDQDGTAIFAAKARFKGYTVAGLPAGTQGDWAFVTDAAAPTYNAALTGGGAVVVPVFYNGAAWVSH
jgi:hypothetical protein